MIEMIGFTGAREIQPLRDVPRVARLIEALPADCTVVTGGCIGIDALVAQLAKARGLRVHTVLPADRSRVDPDWQQHCTSYEELPPGSSYRERNQRIVERSDRLIAIPGYPEDHGKSKRSGTWQTVRLADLAVKRVNIYLLNATPGTRQGRPRQPPQAPTS